MQLLRKYIRTVLKEQQDQFLPDTEVDALAIPKGKWVLLSPGSPEFEAAKNQLNSLITLAYSDIGGHHKISGPESLARYQFWIVQDLDKDPGVDVAMFGKPDIGGNKFGGVGHDGSGPAISAYKNKSAALRAGGDVAGIGNWWGEVGGRPAYAMIKRGAPAIEDEARVRTLLAGDPIVWHGAHPDPDAPPLFKSVYGWYTKSFGGGDHVKIILGSPSI